MPSHCRFESLDLLRGFCAMSVLVYHVIEIFGWSTFPASGLLVWFRIGWMGVDFFFVISGFVIGLSVLGEVDRTGPVHFRTPFFLRRMARIMPLYYLTLLIFVVFVSPELLFDRWWSNLLSHMVFIHNFFPTFSGSINGSNWSLALEMQFYLLMLVVAPWLHSSRPFVYLAPCIVISWMWRWAVLVYCTPSAPVTSLFQGTTQLPGLLDEFAGGLVLAQLVRCGLHEKLFKRSNAMKPLLFGVTGIVTACSLKLYWRYASYWDHAIMVVFYRSALGLTFSLAVLCAVALPCNGVFRTLATPLLYIGKISYGLYLWHLPVILSLKRLPQLSPLLALQLTVVFTSMLAAVSWHAFEKPFMDRLVPTKATTTLFPQQTVPSDEERTAGEGFCETDGPEVLGK